MPMYDCGDPGCDAWRPCAKCTDPMDCGSWRSCCHPGASGLPPQITDLDRAWEAVNALGGTGSGERHAGHEEALGQALDEIEKLGGRDPLTKIVMTPCR